MSEVNVTVRLDCRDTNPTIADVRAFLDLATLGHDFDADSIVSVDYDSLTLVSVIA